MPAFVPGGWIAEHEPNLPDPIIDGLLHRGCKMVLGGGSKTNKTWALCDLAISITAGADWWGLRTVKGFVVYVNFEIQEEFFYQRLREIAACKGIDLNDDLIVLNLRGHAGAAEDLLPELGERLQGKSVAAIIIDPVYKLAMGKNENAAGETSILMNEFEKLAQSTGAAVIFAAHFSKGNQAGKEAMDRISGSGVYARDPDVILTMTKHTEEDAYTVESTLRNCAPLPPFVVRRAHPLMVHAPDLDPAELKQAKVGTARKTFSVDDVVSVLPLGVTHAVGAWRDLARDEAGIGRSRFYELAKKIKEAGHPKITNKNGLFTRIL